MQLKALAPGLRWEESQAGGQKLGCEAGPSAVQERESLLGGCKWPRGVEPRVFLGLH